MVAEDTGGFDVANCQTRARIRHSLIVSQHLSRRSESVEFHAGFWAGSQDRRQDRRMWNFDNSHSQRQSVTGSSGIFGLATCDAIQKSDRLCGRFSDFGFEFVKFHFV